LAAEAVEIFLRVLPLVARLDRANEVVNRAMDFEHLFVVLDFLRVLEESADHPGVGQHDVEPLHCLVGRHGWMFSEATGGGGGDSTFALASACLASRVSRSRSALEYSTRPAPTAASTIPV